MNVERELISYVLISGDKTCLFNGSISSEYFLDDVSRSAYDWIVCFADQYQEVPTPAAFLDNFPEYTLTGEDEFSGPLDFLVDKLYADYRMVLLHLGVSAIDDALGNGDYERAVSALLETSRTVLQTDTGDGVVDGVATAPQRIAEYLEPREKDQLLGIPSGFTFLDEATQGLQPSQLIVIIGLAKSCKTTLTVEIMRSVWGAAKQPLMISFEMSSRQIFQRWDGFAAGVNPRHLQSGDLSLSERARLEAFLHTLDGKHPYVVADDRSSVMTVSGIRAKVESLKPDVLFIDGAYFLTDEISRESQTPIALTNISRSLKQLAMICEIPVIITTQALPGKLTKGNKLGPYSGGYTSAWVQDADVLMGTSAIEDMEGCYQVPILAARNAPPSENLIQVTWDPPMIREVFDADDGLPAV